MDRDSSSKNFLELMIRKIACIPPGRVLDSKLSWHQLGLSSLNLYELRLLLSEKFSHLGLVDEVFEHYSIDALSSMIDRKLWSNPLKNFSEVSTDHDVILCREQELEIRVIAENEMTLETQRSIHILLNEAFRGMSNSFRSKTFSMLPPTFRVLMYWQGKLVAHLGIREDHLVWFDDDSHHRLAMVWIGLFASLSPSVEAGRRFLKATINYLASLGYPIALGVSTRAYVLDELLVSLSPFYFSRSVVGANSRAEDDKTKIVFNLSMSTQDFEMFCAQMTSATHVYAEGDIF
jgi:hypothetical protein